MGMKGSSYGHNSSIVFVVKEKWAWLFQLCSVDI